MSVQPTYELRVLARDTVTLSFRNDSGKRLDLSVGNWWNGEFGKPSNPNDLDPRAQDDIRQRVQVESGSGEGSFTTHFHTRTEITSFKYDVIDGTNVVLDPEVEIRP